MKSQKWWHRPLNPALRRQRQADLFVVQANLIYITRPCLKRKKNKQTEEIKTIFCQAYELTQWEMAPATKPDDLSLTAKPHMVGENLSQIVL